MRIFEKPPAAEGDDSVNRPDDEVPVEAGELEDAPELEEEDADD